MKRRARIIHARAHSIEPARGYAILQLAGVTAGNELARRAIAFSGERRETPTKKLQCAISELQDVTRRSIHRVIRKKIPSWRRAERKEECNVQYKNRRMQRKDQSTA